MNLLFYSPLLVLAACLLAALRRVPGQRVLTVRRFGRYHRTLGPGLHWVIPFAEQAGLEVALVGHRVHIGGEGDQAGAELYYQIMEPEKAGETLDRVDAWVTAQAHEVLRERGQSPEQLKQAMNRRVGPLGLRVVRCSLYAG